MPCPYYRHSHVCVTQQEPSDIAELDELVYIDSKKLADLHKETERLEARIRELEGQVSPPPSPPSDHALESRMIEMQSRQVEDMEHVMIDMRRSARDMEREIRGLADQVRNIEEVDEEKLRARDARISRLEQDLAAGDRNVCAVRRAGLDGGEIEQAVGDLRSSILTLAEEQDKKIHDLEASVGLRDGRLEDYLVLVMDNSLTEIRKACARDVQSIKMAVNKLEALVKAAACTGACGASE